MPYYNFQYCQIFCCCCYFTFKRRRKKHCITERKRKNWFLLHFIRLLDRFLFVCFYKTFWCARIVNLCKCIRNLSLVLWILHNTALHISNMKKRWRRMKKTLQNKLKNNRKIVQKYGKLEEEKIDCTIQLVQKVGASIYYSHFFLFHFLLLLSVYLFTSFRFSSFLFIFHTTTTPPPLFTFHLFHILQNSIVDIFNCEIKN